MAIARSISPNQCLKRVICNEPLFDAADSPGNLNNSAGINDMIEVMRFHQQLGNAVTGNPRRVNDTNQPYVGYHRDNFEPIQNFFRDIDLEIGNGYDSWLLIAAIKMANYFLEIDGKIVLQTMNAKFELINGQTKYKLKEFTTDLANTDNNIKKVSTDVLIQICETGDINNSSIKGSALSTDLLKFRCSVTKPFPDIGRSRGNTYFEGILFASIVLFKSCP